MGRVDFDGDGRPDFGGGQLHQRDGVIVYRNLSTRGLETSFLRKRWIFPCVPAARSFLAVADFDGDGKVHIAVTGHHE